MEGDCIRTLPLDALEDGSGFRNEHCYTEAVDTVLRKHEATLRGLFEVRANSGCSTRQALYTEVSLPLTLSVPADVTVTWSSRFVRRLCGDILPQ